MTKSSILAMDIAQHSALVQLDRVDGSTLWRGTIPTDQPGWQQLEAVLRNQRLAWSDLLVLMEATGLYHLAWAERLTAAHAEVYVLNPLLAARLESFANALRQHKTDRVDVARLAEIARLHAGDLGRFRYRADPVRQARRQLDHVRATLRRNLTNVKKALQSHLELVFPALLAAPIAADSACAARILPVAATAEAWLMLPETQRHALAAAKCAALDQACRQTLADPQLASACAPAVRTLLATMQSLGAHLADCDQQIATHCPAERVHLIRSIPGFGERTATVLATYLPDTLEGWGPKKKIAARLQALWGTDPRLRSSGQWVGKIKISKRGISSARTALFQAAFCSLRTDAENAAYYAALRQRGKSHKQAIVDVMRKQVRRLTAVLYAHRPFVVQTPAQPCVAA
jgi:transposase